MSIDLHCHTRMSDGSTGIDELISLAQKSDVTTISITDHDTFAGSVRGGVIGKRNGVTVIPGVEISTIDNTRGKKAHILCYYPVNPDRLEGTLKKTSDNRRKAMMVSIQKVMCLYPVTADMILRRAQGSTNIFKQHIMQTLMDSGYTDTMFGDVYQKLFNPRIGFAYTKVDYPSVFEIIDDIHEAGGVAVLAHPSEYNSMDLLNELCEKKLIDGVELGHPRNTDEDKKDIIGIAEKYGLFLTGGTDFHGCYTSVCNPVGTFTTDSAQLLQMKKALRAFK